MTFTWRWDHEPETLTRTVDIEFAPEGDSSRLTLTHGFYADTDAEERMGHLDGWLYFLPLLVNLDGLAEK